MLCDVKDKSSTPRAMDIPELLQHIVSFLERRDLAFTAQVSQYWSEFALSVLWEHLPELIILVRVLHPLRWSDEDECWAFAENPAGPDWTRYEFYAPRIRTLRHSNLRRWHAVHDYQEHLSPAVFDLLLTRGPLPPRVGSFHFGVRHDARDLAFLPRLLHSNIKHLEIEIKGEAEYHPERVLKMFLDISHIPDLRLQSLSGWFTVSDINISDAAAPLLLENQNTLEILTIFEYFGPGSRAIQAAAQLSALCSLAIEWQGPTITSHVNSVLQQLSVGCPLLRELKLGWTVPPLFRPETSFDFNNLYNWQLEVLKIGVDEPAKDARPSVGDIQKMGKAWPNLRTLQVNWENPGVGDGLGFGLPLSALDLIASQWPNMTKLNTVFDWTGDLSDIPTARFENLQQLPASEWYIPENKVGEVADYLKALGIRLEAIRHAGLGRQYGGNRELQDCYENSRGRWRAVASAMT